MDHFEHPAGLDCLDYLGLRWLYRLRKDVCLDEPRMLACVAAGHHLMAASPDGWLPFLQCAQLSGSLSMREQSSQKV